MCVCVCVLCVIEEGGISPLKRPYMRSKDQQTPCFILSVFTVTASCTVPKEQTLHVGIKIKKAASHTLSVITDQNQNATLPRTTWLWGEFVYWCRHLQRALVWEGWKVAGTWPGGLDRSSLKSRKMQQNESMSRLQRSNSLTKSRRLSRIMFLQKLQKYKDQPCLH